MDQVSHGSRGNNRFEISSPMGEVIEIPVEPEHDGSHAANPEEGRDHFERHGYVVLRSFLSLDRCKQIVQLFESVIRPWTGPLPRYPTSADEVSRYDERGHVENGLMGAHRWPSPELASFTQSVSDLVGPESDVGRAAATLMDEAAVLIDTFYFEVNGNTTPHRDIDFLPSAEKIVVMWMAFEDIAPGAGRLYVYPDTHHDHSPVRLHSMVTDDYSRQSLAAARACGTSCAAPALRAGDVIAFNGALVHGSLETRDRDRTRHSLTAHFGPARAKIVRA